MQILKCLQIFLNMQKQTDNGLLSCNISKVILLILLGCLQHVSSFQCFVSDEYDQIVVSRHKIHFHKSLSKRYVRLFLANELGLHDMSVKKFQEAKYVFNMNKKLYVISQILDLKLYQFLFQNKETFYQRR